MAIPDFDDRGDLPVSIHKALLDEVVTRFGQHTPQRQLVTKRLLHIYELAKQTGKLERFIIFGSYVTAKRGPNDIDIIIVVNDDLNSETCPDDFRPMFNHIQTQQEFGASVFIIRPSFILLETVDEFIAYWQIKRDSSKHGIIEII